MNYSYFFKKNITNDIGGEKFDILVSAYNSSDRVQKVYKNISAEEKKYLYFSEYNINSVPPDCHEINKNEQLIDFFSNLKDKIVCVDITGFIRHYLIFLVALLKELKFKNVSFIYSEPVQYVKHQNTEFSKGERLGVQPISGLGGESGLRDEKKLLIVGAGFDLTSFKESISFDNTIGTKNKRVLIGFPSLRPDMFQQSMLRIHEIESYQDNFIYAPAFDPFMTAQRIKEEVEIFQKKIGSEEVVVNLIPLSTKPQVLGFALYAVVTDSSQDIDVNV